MSVSRPSFEGIARTVRPTRVASIGLQVAASRTPRRYPSSVGTPGWAKYPRRWRRRTPGRVVFTSIRRNSPFHSSWEGS